MEAGELGLDSPSDVVSGSWNSLRLYFTNVLLVGEVRYVGFTNAPAVGALISGAPNLW